MARNPSAVLGEWFCSREMNKPLKSKLLRKCLAQKAPTGVICRMLAVTTSLLIESCVVGGEDLRFEPC